MENVEDCTTAGTSFEEAGRGCRNKRKLSDPIICPICSVTLRNNEIDLHITCEIDKLLKLSNGKVKQNRISGNVSIASLNGFDSRIDKCWDTYQNIKSNRQNRQKVKAKKRKYDETVVCPVCSEEESIEDIAEHVENCLKRSEEESEEPIDVEGYEEYEWAGQSRIRATSMLQGSLSNLGSSLKMTDEDEDLVVDGDDNQIYGSPQYSETDIILPNDDKERDKLREAVIGASPQEKHATFKDVLIVDLKSSEDPVLLALKNRIRELENKDREVEQSYKCLICMERYKTPVISVCCWHVHCEICWLQTLGAKKLCPQCNMITSPSDLRRIYI